MLTFEERTSEQKNEVGLPVKELSTPCLVVDLDLLENNIERMARLAREQQVALRPHIKTHKTPALGHLQLEAGATGITVARLREGEVFASAGFDDILVAYQVVGPRKIERLINLSRRATVRSCVDNFDAAAELSAMAVKSGANLDLLLDVDTGLQRTGCHPHDAAELGSRINDLPNLTIAGVFSFAGYRPGKPDVDIRRAWAIQEAETTIGISHRLIERGIPATIVSVAGSACAPFAAEVPGVTEIRPGTYIFGDANYARLGAHPADSCALRVRATVVGRPRAEEAVLDSGTKALSSDRAAATDKDVFGYLPDHPASYINRIWEEHAVVQLAPEDRGLRVGDFVEVIPNHACVVMNLSNKWYGVRGGFVEQVHEIMARGESQ